MSRKLGLYRCEVFQRFTEHKPQRLPNKDADEVSNFLEPVPLVHPEGNLSAELSGLCHPRNTMTSLLDHKRQRPDHFLQNVSYSFPVLLFDYYGRLRSLFLKATQRNVQLLEENTLAWGGANTIIFLNVFKILFSPLLLFSPPQPNTKIRNSDHSTCSGPVPLPCYGLPAVVGCNGSVRLGVARSQTGAGRARVMTSRTVRIESGKPGGGPGGGPVAASVI